MGILFCVLLVWYFNEYLLVLVFLMLATLTRLFSSFTAFFLWQDLLSIFSNACLQWWCDYPNHSSILIGLFVVFYMWKFLYQIFMDMLYKCVRVRGLSSYITYSIRLQMLLFTMRLSLSKFSFSFYIYFVFTYKSLPSLRSQQLSSMFLSVEFIVLTLTFMTRLNVKYKLNIWRDTYMIIYIHIYIYIHTSI
jgi:hypothetical protein